MKALTATLFLMISMLATPAFAEQNPLVFDFHTDMPVLIQSDGTQNNGFNAFCNLQGDIENSLSYQNCQTPCTGSSCAGNGCYNNDAMDFRPQVGQDNHEENYSSCLPVFHPTTLFRPPIAV